MYAYLFAIWKIGIPSNPTKSKTFSLEELQRVGVRPRFRAGELDAAVPLKKCQREVWSFEKILGSCLFPRKQHKEYVCFNKPQRDDGNITNGCKVLYFLYHSKPWLHVSLLDPQYPRYLDDASANVALNDLKVGKTREAFGGYDSQHFGGCSWCEFAVLHACLIMPI